MAAQILESADATRALASARASVPCPVHAPLHERSSSTLRRSLA